MLNNLQAAVVRRSPAPGHCDKEREMRRARLLNPLTWLKLAASTIALIANAIQLSEMANDRGYHEPGKESNYAALARMVAFEGRALRRHVGAIE